MCSAVLSLLVFSLSLSLCGRWICGSEGVAGSWMAVTDLWCGSEGWPNRLLVLSLLKGSESISRPYKHSLSLGFNVPLAAEGLNEIKGLKVDASSVETNINTWLLIWQNQTLQPPLRFPFHFLPIAVFTRRLLSVSHRPNPPSTTELYSLFFPRSGYKIQA